MGFGFFKKAKDAIAGAVKKASETLIAGVQKTAKVVRGGLDLLVGRKLGDEECEDLRGTLIQADLGPRLAEDLVEKAREAYKDREVQAPGEIAAFLKAELKKQFPPQDSMPRFSEKPPTVILVVGVNGAGKTTTIAKLAHRFKAEDYKILLAAGDTFRAAAIEQLTIWAGRVGCDIVKDRQGADAASVAYNAVEKAIAQGYDMVIIDTAGRLQNKKGLMDELEKISRVIKKKIPGAPHEVLLVLDGTTGQNAVQQAKVFTEGVGVTGLVVTKLDGTAKGGAVLAMRSEVDVPVKWIGLGEKMLDLEPFDADNFLDAIFGMDESKKSNA
ncbi:MAG: signal recognition particle-docking protein FtsY [Planctomycetes bacterium]|nr:signal recognition particle-docking protein FtsY [Planctomycetota bacterium]